VGSVRIVAVQPAQDRFVVAAQVQGTGGGVELPGGDQVQGLEAFPRARVARLQGSATQVVQALPPLGPFHANHSIPRVWLLGLNYTSGYHMPQDPQRELRISIGLRFSRFAATQQPVRPRNDSAVREPRAA